MAAVFGDTYSRSSTHLIVSLQRSQNHSPSIRAISHQTSNADTTIAPTAIRQSQPIVPVKIDPVSQEKDYNITLDNFIAENEAGSARELVNVTPELFAELKDKLNAMRGLRYEYDEGRLFIQLPCATHERVIAAFSSELHKAMFALHALEPKLELCWTVTANSEAPYDDDDEDGGMFIADLTLCGRSSAPILLLEVVFTQRWAEARHKIQKMLDQGTIFGIVAVNIKEHPVWRKPGPRVDARLPVITEDEFRRIAIQSQRADPYVGLSVGGREWTRRVTCDVYIFPRGCDVEAIQAHELHAQGAIDMTSFDRSLNTIWKNCVQKVSADNQIDPPTAHDLTITWDTLRTKMIDSLINTGYDRYKRWYNKLKKRTLDQTIAAAEMDNGPTASGSGRLVRSRRLR